MSLVVVRTLVAGPDRNQVASRLARRLVSSTLGPLIAFSVKHEQFISRFSPSQGSPRGQWINLRHESPAVPASSICPNLFLTLPPPQSAALPLSEVEAFWFRSLASPPHVYERFHRIFCVSSHGKNVCVCFCVSKTLVCPVWSLRGRPDFLTTDHFLRGDTSSLQRLRLLLLGAHRSGASPLDAAFLFFLFRGTARTRNVHRVLKRGGRTIFATPG